MKQIILGTAGHIDHGKTSLIKAITGIDTDRLKEEKRRGITIELGFASLDLSGGRRIGVVDVPGHEKFVKNMVAGATGIDIVVMVIAADESIMPQTREHMEICTLLGIKHGCVALTKSDLVDEEWLEVVIDDVRDFLQGTFLEKAPILSVSSVSGKGIPEFIQVLEEISATIPERAASGLFRLPADRVFTMKGFGTVITGTLISGSVSVGDTIMIYPSGIRSRVRGIQVHNRSVNIAEAGMRTAINFQGLDRVLVNRGDVLADPDTLRSSYMVDVSIHFLHSNKKPIKNRSRIRFHTGTSEVLGIIALLEEEEILPGETTVAQIRLDSPVAVVKDDRFVIRSYSPIRTIGGGQVLNPIPPKHKRFRSEIVEGLKKLVEQMPEETIPYHVEESGYRGASFTDLKIMTNISDKQLDSAIQGLMSQKTVVCVDREKKIYIHKNNFETLKTETVHYLSSYHQANPLKAGMPKEELKSKYPSAMDSKLFNLVLNRMLKDHEIVSEENSVRLAQHKVALEVDQADIRKKMLDIYKEAGLQPPYSKDLSTMMNIDAEQAKDVLMLLIDQGRVVKIKEELCFYSEAVDRLQKSLVDYLVANNEITTQRFKEMTGASRKYVIPLSEYFDARNVTLRVGDVRKLRKG